MTNDRGEKDDLSNNSQYIPEITKWRQRMVDHLAERGTEYVRNNKLVFPRQNRLKSPNYPMYVGLKPQTVSYMKTNLFECCPNPFKTSISIKYRVPRNCKATIDIVDLSGRKIISLQNKYVTKGDYSLMWSGTDEKARRVSTGTYFCRMKIGNLMSVKKISFIK